MTVTTTTASPAADSSPPAGAASLAHRRALDCSRARAKGDDRLGRAPAVGRGQFAGDRLHDDQQDVREIRGRRRLRPHRRLSRLPVVGATVEAFVSGNLNFGMWGNTPIVRLLAQNQPIQLLSVGEGHFRFVLATRKDSPIRNVADLKGKTVGALLGGDPYNVLAQMLRLELGNADPKAHGITVVNTPTQAQAATIPAGMDAAILIHPAFLKAEAEIGTVGIMNSSGYTESHYKVPAGEGAGLLLPNAKKSAFWPDGYYLHLPPSGSARRR